MTPGRPPNPFERLSGEIQAIREEAALRAQTAEAPLKEAQHSQGWLRRNLPAAAFWPEELAKYPRPTHYRWLQLTAWRHSWKTRKLAKKHGAFRDLRKECSSLRGRIWEERFAKVGDWINEWWWVILVLLVMLALFGFMVLTIARR